MPAPTAGIALYLFAEPCTLLSPREFDVYFHDQLRRPAAWLNFMGEGFHERALIVGVLASTGTAAAGRSTRFDIGFDASLPNRNWQAHPEVGQLPALSSMPRCRG